MGLFDLSEFDTGRLALEQGRAGLVLLEIRKKKVQLDLWHGIAQDCLPCTCDLPVLRTQGQRQTVNLHEQNQEQITNSLPPHVKDCAGLPE